MPPKNLKKVIRPKYLGQKPQKSRDSTSYDDCEGPKYVQ